MHCHAQTGEEVTQRIVCYTWEAAGDLRAGPNFVELRIPEQPPCGVLIDVPVPSQNLHGRPQASANDVSCGYQ